MIKSTMQLSHRAGLYIPYAHFGKFVHKSLQLPISRTDRAGQVIYLKSLLGKLKIAVDQQL